MPSAAHEGVLPAEEGGGMMPLSDIVIYFHEHYNRGESVSKSSLRRFSMMDLEMLVDMGILYSYMDEYRGQIMYRLRRPRTAKGTKMIYSQRVQYAKDWQKNHKVAA